ncbi:MAG: CIA30 family protein [Bacteroidota bacterium]
MAHPFLLILLTLCSLSWNKQMKIDFGTQKDGQQWRVINDGVMGGLSQAQIAFDRDVVRYEGKISLDNNGGFSSFRSPYGRYDLSDYETVEIRFRSQGPTFGFTLETNSYFYLPYYKVILKAKGDQWQTKRFRLRDFKAYQLGRPTGESLADSDKAKVIRLGFINHDKVADAFAVEIDYILFE